MAVSHAKERFMIARTIKMAALLAASLALLTGLPFPGAPHASATHSIPVTVTITREIAIGGDLEDLRGGNDLYAGVEINGVLTAGNSFALHTHGEDDVSPFWTFTNPSVPIANDAAPGSIPVSIEAWEHDDCETPFCDNTGVFESNDDKGDVDPGADDEVNLILDLATGAWSGETTGSCSQGEGGSGEDSKAVRICWDICIVCVTGDTDGDFLLDGWESRGADTDGNPGIEVNLPAMGANPLRKDLFLEIDCLVAANHSHCPLPGPAANPAANPMQTVVQSFANAPVNNNDGTTGIQLHIDLGNLYGQAPGAPSNCNVALPLPLGCVLRTGVAPGGVTGTYGNYGGGNQIPEAGNLIVDWDGATGRAGTNFFSLKGPPGNNFNSNRDLIFRYAIFVHQTNLRAANNDCTSGWAKGIPGVNLLVSLGGTRGTTGNPCWETDAGGSSVGSQNRQAGALMHEFGHTLGLCHGGQNDAPSFQQCNTNNKPNYLSVMNYSFWVCGVPAVATAPAPGVPGGCDYSRFNLPTPTIGLNENSLDECQGIDNNALGLGPRNWDLDTVGPPPPPPALPVANLEGVTNCQPPNSANVQANINGDTSADANGNGIQDGTEPPLFSTLNGFEDWNSLFYGFRTLPSFQSGGAPVDNEPDPESTEAARAYMANLLRPALSVDKTGPSDAVPGDTLNYGIEVKNNGNGPAMNSVLTDTKPDSTQTVFDLGIVVAAAEATRTVSFSVPCATSDGTVLTNSASVTVNDMLGNAFSASDSVQTTVHAPVLTVSKTATASVNAGEAITYTITYANTGSGAASNVTITDTLPAGVYYSKALDLGTGPQPGIVTPNADGTTTLTWAAGNLAGNSGTQTIQYTARPSLLFLGGESLSNSARLTFTNANGCTYTPVTASASTTVTVVPPSRDPQGLGFWRTHLELETSEILARIQATDIRFDGADGTSPDGMLSLDEVTAVLVPGGNMDKVLEEQLIGIYFNLATRRINAATLIESRTADRLGLNNVRDAALYADGTLELPVNSANRARFSDATRVLDEINSNRSEVY
jgi:uncharacterized repeat protein (TIGR01451 family)